MKNVNPNSLKKFITLSESEFRTIVDKIYPNKPVSIQADDGNLIIKIGTGKSFNVSKLYTELAKYFGVNAIEDLYSVDGNVLVVYENASGSDKFYEALKDKYDTEDFTGHIGVLLDEHLDVFDAEAVKAKKAAKTFIFDVYNIATKYV